MDKLKPCPFCGEEAEYRFTEFDEYGETVLHYIYCKVCDAEISKDTQQEAITAWNTRWQPTCESCKYLQEPDYYKLRKCKALSDVWGDDFYPKKNFGCTEWESKE